MGFQRTSGLAETGEADDPTWQLLERRGEGQPLVVRYVVTQKDVEGPFTPDIPADLMEQARLKNLGYRNALEAVAEKFHASPALLRRLNPQSTFSQAGDEIMVPNVEPMDLATLDAGARRGRQSRAGANGAEAGVTIVVTAATGSATVEDERGKVLFHAPVTSGSQHDPLPVGKWQVTVVQPMPTFNYNPELFWDADPSHAKARIAPGPNNPVGAIWLGLSAEHYGIHGTPEPSKVGHTQSHGCVRLTNWDALRLARWAQPGTTVVFR
jgi:lipoprotein-anchoring transpeptidase ErfK/SrfK